MAILPAGKLTKSASLGTGRKNGALLRRYSGRNAAEYDARRRDSERYRIEQEALAKLLSSIAPKTVLDIPIGTGRFLPLYAARGIKVTGVDLSEDMLAVARAKSTLDLVSLRLGDALDPHTFGNLADKFDAVVSVRFLNWLSPGEMQIALQNFAGIRPRHLILGAHVRGGNGFAGDQRFSYRRIKRLFRLRRAKHFVHSEQAIFETVGRSAFVLRERQTIYVKSDQVNHFYHFEQT
jgi:SAM-dependent methyltransferase